MTTYVLYCGVLITFEEYKDMNTYILYCGVLITLEEYKEIISNN